MWIESNPIVGENEIDSFSDIDKAVCGVNVAFKVTTAWTNVELNKQILLTIGKFACCSVILFPSVKEEDNYFELGTFDCIETAVEYIMNITGEVPDISPMTVFEETEGYSILLCMYLWSKGLKIGEGEYAVTDFLKQKRERYSLSLIFFAVILLFYFSF